jgi:hypothetical protein
MVSVRQHTSGNIREVLELFFPCLRNEGAKLLAFFMDHSFGIFVVCGGKNFTAAET